jgi:integrase
MGSVVRYKRPFPPLPQGCSRRRACGAQFRDLRAKAATDKLAASGDVTAAQRLLGHSRVGMTESYLRKRKRHRVTPVR